MSSIDTSKESEKTSKEVKLDSYQEALCERLIKITHPDKDEDVFNIAGFGCELENVAQLVRNIFKEAGIKKEVVTNNANYRQGEVIVVEKNTNNHSYPLNEVYVVTEIVNLEKCRAIGINGKKYNYLPRERAGIRKATPEEIRTFIANYKGVIL